MDRLEWECNEDDNETLRAFLKHLQVSNLRIKMHIPDIEMFVASNSFQSGSAAKSAKVEARSSSGKFQLPPLFAHAMAI